MSQGARYLDEGEFRSTFPNLQPGEYNNTSIPTAKYNCIAHAAGRNDRWWEPYRGPGYYWPPDLPITGNLDDYAADNFARAFESIGFVRSAITDTALEDGVEKVVVYADGGLGTHAALQLPTGRWTSKLGEHQDIDHPSPESLEGDEYGHVFCVLKRSRQQPPPA